MPRIADADREGVPNDIGQVLAAQEARYGAVLANHLVLARIPQLFRGFRAMWTALESSGKLSAQLAALLNVRVASVIGCGL